MLKRVDNKVTSGLFLIQFFCLLAGECEGEAVNVSMGVNLRVLSRQECFSCLFKEQLILPFLVQQVSITIKNRVYDNMPRMPLLIVLGKFRQFFCVSYLCALSLNSLSSLQDRKGDSSE